MGSMVETPTTQEAVVEAEAVAVVEKQIMMGVMELKEEVLTMGPIKPFVGFPITL